MPTDYESAVAAQEREVKAEAAKLVERGYSPWGAIQQARENIRRRREFAKPKAT